MFLATGVMGFLPGRARGRPQPVRPQYHVGRGRDAADACMPANWSLAEGAGQGVSPMQPRFRAYPKMRNLWVETGATPPPPCGFRTYPRARNLWVETGATPPPPPPPPPHAASPAMSATAQHHMQQHLMLLQREHLRQQGMQQDTSEYEYHSV